MSLCMDAKGETVATHTAFDEGFPIVYRTDGMVRRGQTVLSKNQGIPSTCTK